MCSSERTVRGNRISSVSLVFYAKLEKGDYRNMCEKPVAPSSCCTLARRFLNKSSCTSLLLTRLINTAYVSNQQLTTAFILLKNRSFSGTSIDTQRVHL